MKKYLSLLVLLAVMTAQSAWGTLASTVASYTDDSALTKVNRVLNLGYLSGAASAATGVTVNLSGYVGFQLDANFIAYDGTVQLSVANVSTGPWEIAWQDNTTNDAGTAVPQTKQVMWRNTEGWKYLKVAGDSDAGSVTFTARLYGNKDLQKTENGLADWHSMTRRVTTQASTSTTGITLQEVHVKGQGANFIVNCADFATAVNDAVFWCYTKSPVTGEYVAALNGAAITNTAVTKVYTLCPATYKAAATNAVSTILPSVDNCFAVGVSLAGGTASWQIDVQPIP